MNLSPAQLDVIKDNLMLHFIVQQGGSFTMTYDELLKLSEEFNGYGVFLQGNAESFTLKVLSPERITHEPPR